jgi:hypothetical protein
MKIKLLCAVALTSSSLPLLAATLSESTFTDIIKDVNVVAATTKASSPAKVSALLKAPDLVRTGADSRAELTAADQTITRVGANTVFSFEPAGRNLQLEKGSILFHSPAGKGGGNIKTAGASAAILGTTIIVSATPDGGFKLIVLEGTAQATLPNGQTITLQAGQMVIIPPGSRRFGEVLTINLDRLVTGSQLINGFPNELPSRSRINDAVNKQNDDLAKGRAQDTGVSANEFAGSPRRVNGLGGIDHNSYKTAVGTPLTQAQIGTILQGGSNGRGVVTGTGLVPVKGGAAP